MMVIILLVILRSSFKIVNNNFTGAAAPPLEPPMKVSKQQMADNRERIVDAAARLFRERGFDGIGVADLMKAAGLTHGGFYGHFASKEDLMARAVEHSMAGGHALVEQLAAQTPGDTGAQMAAVTDWYLSCHHRDGVGQGCAVAALGADAARQGPSVRKVVTQGLRDFVDLLARLVPGRDEAERRQRALATYASLVGALVMARAADDEALSREVLEAVRATLPMK
jgi:TetR/AcrR family transcriptional repressor of nem operon